MKTFHVSFFKNLASSDGHQFKCLQDALDVTVMTRMTRCCRQKNSSRN